MAYECFYGKFSQKSDVWAFGVTMWEIFTLANEQPCNDMSYKQIIEDALKGWNRKLLVKPYMCPLEVYEVMLQCWAYDFSISACEELKFITVFILFGLPMFYTVFVASLVPSPRAPPGERGWGLGMSLAHGGGSLVIWPRETTAEQA